MLPALEAVDMVVAAVEVADEARECEAEAEVEVELKSRVAASRNGVIFWRIVDKFR